MPAIKFDATVEVAFKMGIDPRKSDQNVRGAVSLPKGTGKSVSVVVIAAGAQAEEAKAAGADYAGYEDLIEKIKGGWLDFDVLIATPDAMKQVRPLGRVLGPADLCRIRKPELLPMRLQMRFRKRKPVESNIGLTAAHVFMPRLVNCPLRLKI